MVRTVTFNTGFDEIVTVSNVTFGGVEDMVDRREQAAGKGVNAARIVHALGRPVIAYGLVGADDRDLFERLLVDDGVSAVLVSVPGRTRRNLTLVSESDHRLAAHFRAEGFVLERPGALVELTRLLESHVRPRDVVTINGSIPRGADVDAWPRLASMVHDSGAQLIVDVYGRSLPEVMRIGGRAVLACKPNEREIDDLPGVPAAGGPERWRPALRFMAGQGVRLPIVTLGAEGVRFAERGVIWEVRSVACPARVSVGAGDAFTGALAVGTELGMPPDRELIRYATAVAAAYVESVPGDQIPHALPELERRVRFIQQGRL